MRKTFTKEIPFTAFKLSKMEMLHGKPVARDLPPEIMIGNITPEKAKKEMIKKYKDDTLLLYSFESTTRQFEMSIDTFLEHATLKTKEEVKTND